MKIVPILIKSTVCK